MIIFGGVESKKTIKKCLYQSNINAVAVGNRLNYSENCIDILKKNQKVLR
jgi:hypothetical protein